MKKALNEIGNLSDKMELRLEVVFMVSECQSLVPLYNQKDPTQQKNRLSENCLSHLEQSYVITERKG